MGPVWPLWAQAIGRIFLGLLPALLLKIKGKSLSRPLVRERCLDSTFELQTWGDLKQKFVGV